MKAAATFGPKLIRLRNETYISIPRRVGTKLAFAMHLK
jgi:hypothetical protein